MSTRKNFLRTFLLSLALMLVFASFGFVGVSADSESAIHASNTTNSQEEESFIKSYVNILSSQKPASISCFLTSDQSQEIQNLFKNAESKTLGYRNIVSAEVAFIKPLSSDQMIGSTDVQYYQDAFPGYLKGYLLGQNNIVRKEDKYSHNGLNVFIVFLVKEENRLRVAEYSAAPAWLIENFFSKEDTAKDHELNVHMEILNARRNGVILGSQGTILETNIASPEQLLEEKGVSESNANMLSRIRGTMPPYTRPDTIRVKRASLNRIDNVSFYLYCKNVLPNEWISSWGSEALKAGAQCVKMVGWYRVREYTGEHLIKYLNIWWEK